MCSNNCLHVQGRTLSLAQLTKIEDLIAQHPDWSRHRIAKELCQWWEWRSPGGQLKTFAARSLLLTLAQRHGLALPAIRENKRRRPWGIGPMASQPEASSRPIEATLKSL